MEIKPTVKRANANLATIDTPLGRSHYLRCRRLARRRRRQAHHRVLESVHRHSSNCLTRASSRATRRSRSRRCSSGRTRTSLRYVSLLFFARPLVTNCVLGGTSGYPSQVLFPQGRDQRAAGWGDAGQEAGAGRGLPVVRRRISPSSPSPDPPLPVPPYSSCHVVLSTALL